jgi:glutamine amidotransferase
MSGGRHDVQATFWLLDAPDSLLLQSERQPDGVGLGTFDADGRPSIWRRPVSALRSETFIANAHEVRSRTFVSHIRHATAGKPTLENTHPFEQRGRLFAHNGVIGDLAALRRRLGDYVELVQGTTDSELLFALITKHIDEHGGDVGRGIATAANELASEVPLYSLNLVLTTHAELWALRYPDTNELSILERSVGNLDPGSGFDERSLSGIMRVMSRELSVLPATVIASERLDSSARWRMLEPGELIHVDADLRVSSTIAVPNPPVQLMDLNAQEAIAQRPA